MDKLKKAIESVKNEIISAAQYKAIDTVLDSLEEVGDISKLAEYCGGKIAYRYVMRGGKEDLAKVFEASYKEQIQALQNLQKK